jgi:hypothetical protein
MKHNEKCDFNIVINKEDSEALNDVYEHISHCKVCLNNYIKLENILDKFKFQKKISFNVDMDSEIDNYENKPTPIFLKNIIGNELKKPLQSKMERIIVKIQDKLEVIGNYIDNLIISTNSLEPVPVRGNSNTKKDNSGVVEFYQKLKGNELIQYHLLQDGPDSILLTIKMENFSSEPLFLALRSDNKLVSSKMVDKNYVNFPKLGAGDYEIEASFDDKKSSIFIPITIVT